MDDIHGPHGAAGVVEHPLLVQVDMAGRARLAVQLVHDILDDGSRVVAVRRDAALGEIVQVVRVEDVKGLEMPLEEVEDGAEHADEEREQCEDARHACLLVSFAVVRRYCYRMGQLDKSKIVQQWQLAPRDLLAMPPELFLDVV